jgi:ribosomal protein L7/L12
MAVPDVSVPDWLAEARAARDRGQKLEAIRIVRAKMGLPLGAARDWVDDGSLDRPLPPRETWPEVARRALTRGKKILAIKIVRARLGLGLKDAKDFVEAGKLDDLEAD